MELNLKLKNVRLFPLYKGNLPSGGKYLDKDRTFSEDGKRRMPGIYLFQNGNHIIVGYSDFNVVHLAYRRNAAKNPDEYKLGIYEVDQKHTDKLPALAEKLKKEWLGIPLDDTYQKVLLPCIKKKSLLPLKKLTFRDVFALDSKGNYKTRKIHGLNGMWKVCGFDRQAYDGRIGVYIIAKDDVPCYVGASWNNFYGRFYVHFRDRSSENCYRLNYFKLLDKHHFTATFIEVPQNIRVPRGKDKKKVLEKRVKRLERYVYNQLKEKFKLDNRPKLEYKDIKKMITRPMPEDEKAREAYWRELYNFDMDHVFTLPAKKALRERIDALEKLLGMEAPF